MPDALETMISQVPDVAPPAVHSFKDTDVAERWKEGFGPKEPAGPAPEETPAPEKKPESKSDIPDSVLGIDKKEDKKVEEPNYLETDPVGQITHKHFKAVKVQAKAEIEAEKARYAQAEKELNELRGKLKDDYVPEEFKKKHEDTLKRLTEREEELGRLAVERSDTFKERFTNKQAGILKTLQETGKELEIRPDIIDQLLSAKGKRRFELLEEVDATSTAKAYLTSLLKDHDQIEYDKTEFLSDWKNKAARMEEEQKIHDDAHKAKIKEMEDRIFEDRWNALSKQFKALEKIEGNDNWNSWIDTTKDQAKAYMDGDFTTEQFSDVVIAGLSAPRIYGMFELAQSRLKEALAENAQLKAAGPSAPPPGSKTPVVDDSKMTAEERYKRTFDNIVGSAANNGLR